MQIRYIRGLAATAVALESILGACFAYAANYEIDVKLNTAASYQALQVDINYSATGGTFVGDGATVSCTTNSAINATSAYNEAPPVLTAAFIRTSGITGPVVLATCLFTSSTTPLTSQFVRTVTDWEASHTLAPTIIISRIQQVP